MWPRMAWYLCSMNSWYLESQIYVYLLSISSNSHNGWPWLTFVASCHGLFTAFIIPIYFKVTWSHISLVPVQWPWRTLVNESHQFTNNFDMREYLCINMCIYMGQVMKVCLFCYLVLLSVDNLTFVIWPIYTKPSITNVWVETLGHTVLAEQSILHTVFCFLWCCLLSR